MSIRFRGSIIGNDPTPTTSGASGIYDLDAYTTYTSISSWPAATAGLYRIPGLVFFAQGQKYNSGNNSYSAYTVMSYYSASGTLVSESNPAGVTTGRAYTASAGYGYDKAVTHGGRYGGSNSSNYVNLVSNTGTVAADDTTSAPGGTTLEGHGAATYGFNKAIFLWGFRVSSLSTIWVRGVYTMNENAVWASIGNTTYYHLYSTAVGYGNDKVVAYASTQYANANGTGSTGGQALCYIDGLGTVGAEQTWAHSLTSYWSGTRYGADTAVFLDFSGATKYYAYVTNTGTIGSDTAITMSTWTQPSATALPGGSALVAYGQYNSSNNLRPLLTISNTGVFGSVSTVAEPTNQSRSAAGYS